MKPEVHVPPALVAPVEARRRLSEQVAFYERLGCESKLTQEAMVIVRVSDVRALLAEEPPVGQLIEGEPGHESCVGCGRPVGDCMADPLPDADGYEDPPINCGTFADVRAYHVTPAPTAFPPGVREAAEEGRVVVTATRRVGDKDTMSFDGTTFTTVRACCDCGVLICGGPTRCLYCAAKLPASAPGAGCTGIAASWCPVHGNCSCPRDEEGARMGDRSARDCPLHGDASTHADAEVSALAARRGA